MKIVTSLRQMKYNSMINSNIIFYRENAALPDREKRNMQLQLWNKEWSRIVKDVPFYRDLKQQKNIPDTFGSWDDFFQYLPVINKKDIRNNVNYYISNTKKEDFKRVSGGTTGEVFKMPGWNSEVNITTPNTWTALSWYNIDMHCKKFLLWGRSHTLGTGFEGFLNKSKRLLYDRLLNIYRFSAYDLNPQAMREAGLKLLQVKPDYLFGYSAALDHFARANIELRDQFRNCHLKVVIGTAEAYPTLESKIILQDLFQCPVGNEYGTVETGVIAYTKPNKPGYHVLWRSYFLEAEKMHPELPGWSLRITSLYPRCFPLVRYDLGDEIIPAETSENFIGGIYNFADVLGRKDDFVVLPNGAVIHMSAFHNAFKLIFKKVLSCQVIQEKQEIKIYYTSAKELATEDIIDLRGRLKKVDAQLENVTIVKIDKKIQTISGKTPMIIKR